MKIIYMGTPDFAAEALEAIIGAGHEITLVVTQPDKEKGRGREIQISPVKECALKHKLPIFQPTRIRNEESVSELKKYEADIFVVCAFGQILTREILDMPKYGSINIHASLLPKYRGAAPIQWAILNGDKVTGVTIMQMDDGIDTGDMLYKKEIPIEPGDTGESLFNKLAKLGAEAVVEALPLIEDGKIVPEKQNEAEATHVGKISKEMGKINWTESADKIERYVRGLNSWPSAYTYINGKMLKIWGAYVTPVNEKNIEPGTVICVNKDSFTVMTGEDALTITGLQLEGKKRMDTGSFLLGYEIKEGMRL